MISIKALFEQAQLAEASYANLLPGVDVSTELQNADNNMHFSRAQATAFVSQWRVVNHIPDTQSGFSATLFQDIETGRYTLALRGTNDLADLAADIGDIVLDGIAMDQVVEMFNFWRSLTSKGVYQAAQLETMVAETAQLRLLALGIPFGGKAVYDTYLASLKSTGAILDTTITGTTVRQITWADSNVVFGGSPLSFGSGELSGDTALDVVGSSLGGHLAAAFTRLFPLVPAQAITINGAGFPTGLTPGLGGDASANIFNLFAALGGASSFNSASILNIHGSGPRFVTMNSQFGLVQQGIPQEVFIESTFPAPAHAFGHGNIQVTDSLAVYDLFARIDSLLRTASIDVVHTSLKPMFEAASAQALSSHERLIDGLAKLFGLNVPLLLDEDNREELFKGIILLRDAITAQTNHNPDMRVDVLANTISDVDLSNIAQRPDAIAYRYALKELNPFAILGNNDIYSPHNVNGELDLYNSAAGVGMTERYLADRSEMLKWKNLDYAADGQRALHSTQIETNQYTDKTLKDAFGNDLTFTVRGRQLGSVSTPAKVIFGIEEGGTITGGDVAAGDHLYGGGGGDVLDGQGGNDYLEGGPGSDTLIGGEGDDILFGGAGDDTLAGGAGRDVLDGGIGFDTYRYSSSDGPDTIADADGKGQIFFDGVLLTGGSGFGPNLWRSADERFQFTLYDDGDGAQTLSVSGSGTLFVKDFAPGKFGIGLEDAPQPAPTPPAGGREILGIYAPQIFDNPPDLNNPPPGYQYLAITSTDDPNDYVLRDDLGNLVRDPARPWTGGHQDLFGSSGGDHIVGSDFGNSLAGFSGSDHLQGGRALDAAGGGQGNDFIEGGAFFDMPLEDWLNAVAFFPEGEIRGASDDRLFGGAGEDVIFGGTAADLEALLDPTTPSAGHKGDWVAGEMGDDQLYGSTGHDVLLGGGGGDLLIGGSGDDVLTGDDSFSTSHTTNPAAGAWTWRIDSGSSPFDVRFFPVSVMPWLDWSESYYKRAGDDDILFGGAGNDILLGQLGRDTLFGETGDDVLTGWEGDDTLLGGEGDDIIAGDFGRYERPNERLVGFTHSVPAGFLDANTGDSGEPDQTGNDYLDGGAGDDVLYGEGGNDTVLGGDGNDTLWGDAAYLPEELQGADYLNGGAGNDALNGGAGDDTLIGGRGDDALDGNEGSDTYIFARGDGADVVADSGMAGTDELIFEDYAENEVSILRRADGSLLITGANGDAVTIQRYAGNGGSGIERILFADGTSLTQEAIVGLPIAAASIGGAGWTQASDGDDVISTFGLPGNSGGFVLIDAASGNDLVFGDASAVIYGNQGNDRLFGGDTLIGGDGDDRMSDAVMLIGGAGNDELLNGAILDGGPGNDFLNGGFGASRYLITFGDIGIDTISDSGDSQDAFLDSFYASLGIFDWRDRQGVETTQYVIIEFGTFETLEEASAVLAEFGLTWDEAVASGFARALEPLPPAPQIAANDYAALAPFYESGVIERDALELGPGITLEDLSFSWDRVALPSPSSGELQPYVALNIGIAPEIVASVVIPHSDDALGTGIEEVRFADGTLVDIAEIIALASPAPDFDPHLAIEFVFEPGSGVQVLDGFVDRVRFGEGVTSDSLSLGLGSLLIRVGDGGDELHILNFDPGDVFGIQAVGEFLFADGSVLSYAELIARGFDLFGTAGDDFTTGTNVTDRIRGGTGDDLLAGGQGSDRYLYGPGDGTDTIIETLGDSGAIDALMLEEITPGEVTVAREGEDLILSLPAGGAVTLASGVAGTIEAVEFGDGTLWDAATLLAHAVSPNRPPQLTELLADVTALEDMPFALTLPIGVFLDPDADDVLSFGATLTDASPLPDWLAFDAATQTFSGVPTNDDVGALDITVTATDTGSLSVSDTFTLIVENVNDTPVLTQPLSDQSGNQNAAFSFQVRDGSFTDVDAGDALSFTATLVDGSLLPLWLEFDGGTKLFDGTPSEFDIGSVDIRVMTTDVGGASVSDTFTLFISDASTLDEMHVGTPRDDVLVTGFANDLIDAGRGDDLVHAGAGRDTVFGGSGHDWLFGEAGNDVLAGDEGHDHLLGGLGDDLLAGGEGHDQLEGGAGDDLYLYEQHGGHDVIEETGGKDTLLLGEGITADRVRLSRRHDDLAVEFKGRDGSVTVKSWFAREASQIERIEFADGTVWGVEDIRNRAKRYKPERSHDDDDDPGPQRPFEGHHGKSDSRRNQERNIERPQRQSNRFADLVETYLAQRPHYEFERVAEELTRADGRARAFSAHEIARRWQTIDRYTKRLATEQDEDARGAPPHSVHEYGLLGGGGGAFGSGFGYTGSTGMARGIANLRTLQGLEEGLQRLHA